MDLAKLIALLQKHPDAKIVIPTVGADGQVTETVASTAYFLEDLDGNATVRLQ